MAIWPNGKGRKAPYETTHVRVPVPLKPKVDQLIDEYKRKLVDGTVPEREKYNCPDAMTLTSLQEAVAIANQLLKKRKSKKECLESLLTDLYQGKVELE